MPAYSSKPLITATLLAAALLVAGIFGYLAKDLPDEPGSELNFPAAGFHFAFGTGHPVGERMVIDTYSDGFALLSSGPVKIEAEKNKVLRYTWLPSRDNQEAVFFWRQQGANDNVVRARLPAAGTHYLDLSLNAGWHGEVTEFGFLLLDDSGVDADKSGMELGPAALVPDKLKTRLALVWQSWTVFEDWSQQSINFLYGGADHQIIPLPLLVSACLILTLLLFWLISHHSTLQGPRHTGKTLVLLCLLAWMVLDIRWTANNFRHLQLALPSLWNTDTPPRLSNNLDEEVLQYVEQLKSGVLGETPARILILGDRSVPDYYLQRAKYHLLPHSVNATRKIDHKLVPESLDFVIFFGPPDKITRTRGWSPVWRQALRQLNTQQLATIYEVKTHAP